MNLVTNYYSLADDAIVHLGKHEDWFSAEEKAPGNSHWIFDATTFRPWVLEFQRQTPEELAGSELIMSLQNEIHLLKAELNALRQKINQ